MSLHQSDRFTSVEQFWHELDTNATSLEVPALVASPLAHGSATDRYTLSEKPTKEDDKEQPVTPLPRVAELSTDQLANAESVNDGQGDRKGY